MFKKLAVAVAALALLTPSIALAQDAPPPADVQGAAPSYAQQQEQSPDEQIRGRVIAFDGGYALTVQDERGYQDSVQLHPGTIINPTGLTLEPGMTVSILGYNAGAFFAANEIDTPYQFVAGVPYFYGHPYFYYGPGISLDFFFGRGGWWHPEYFGGGLRYVGGARFYSSVRVNAYGGEYRGAYGNGYGNAYHAFRAPQESRAYQPSHYGSPAGGQRYGENYGRYSTGAAQNANAYRGGQSGYRGTEGSSRSYTAARGSSAHESSHASSPSGNRGGGGGHRH